MLVGKQLRVRFYRDRVLPSYLDTAAPEWLEVADRLLQFYQGQEGRTRGEIEEDIKESFNNDPQLVVIQGLAKLLEDRCEFDVVAGKPPDELRQRVFLTAAEQRREAAQSTQPAQNFDRAAVLTTVASEFSLSVDAVEQGLFADLRSEQQLIKFKDISADRLLQRYNVALAQAVLLRSTGVNIYLRRESPQRFRQLLRRVKFHRLIAELKRDTADTYLLRLDGPLSLFSSTQKYGLQLAMFLPAVLQCKEFALQADLVWGPQRKVKKFSLADRDGLISPEPDIGMYVPPEQGMFAELFRKKVTDWEIHDEAELLPLGDGSFWVPDFRLEHPATGRKAYLEILGFWRRSGVEKHLQRLREHIKLPVVLAVSDQLHIDEAELAGMPAGIHRFKQMPLPEEVVKAAEAMSV